MSEISRRSMLKIAGFGAVPSEETKASEKESSLQDVAEKISVDDKPEHKNGWFGSMFGGIVMGFGFSYLLLFVFLKNPYYDYLFLPLSGIIAVIAFFLIKDDINDDKKELVANSIFNDLYHLKDAFVAKFDSRYDSISFIVENFYIDYRKGQGFVVVYHDKFDFLKDADKTNPIELAVLYQLNYESVITAINKGETSHKFSDTKILVVGKNYFIDTLLKYRKELRKAINKLLESSELVYINDMTYICVSK
jgi:hypothetical protein